MNERGEEKSKESERGGERGGETEKRGGGDRDMKIPWESMQERCRAGGDGGKRMGL